MRHLSQIIFTHNFQEKIDEPRKFLFHCISDDVTIEPLQQQNQQAANDASEGNQNNAPEENKNDAPEGNENDASEENQNNAREENQNDAPEENQNDAPERNQNVAPDGNQNDATEVNKKDESETPKTENKCDYVQGKLVAGPNVCLGLNNSGLIFRILNIVEEKNCEIEQRNYNNL